MSRPRMSPHQREEDPLGSKLWHARWRRKLTQQDVAQALDVGQSTVSAWESGKVRPNVVALKRLAALLEVPLTELIDAAEASALTAVQ